MDFRTHSMSGETLEWKGVISMYCHCKGCVTSCCIPCQQIGTVTGPTGPTGPAGTVSAAGAVSNISQPDSASAQEVATTLNSLLDSLRAAGLLSS